MLKNKSSRKFLPGKNLLRKILGFFSRKKPVSLKPKKDLPVHIEPVKKERLFPQHAVAEAKYYTGQEPKPEPRRQVATELPWGYGEDKIVLQVRDPWWLHSYWELTAARRERLIGELGDRFFKGQPALRVYDVSNIIFDGNNAHRYFDVDVQFDAGNWYIDVGGPGRSWCVDLGIKLSDGSFITIVRSNVVATPLDGPSWITDEEWMIPEDIFARLYGMGFGLGRSSPVGKGWQEKIRGQMISSPGISSSPVKKQQMPSGY